MPDASVLWLEYHAVPLANRQPPDTVLSRGDNDMTDKWEVERALKAQQIIQQNNPPTSDAWKQASREIHRLAELLTGKKPKDACGRGQSTLPCSACGKPVELGERCGCPESEDGIVDERLTHAFGSHFDHGRTRTLCGLPTHVRIGGVKYHPIMKEVNELTKFDGLPTCPKCLAILKARS